jgi:hypothetical protein
LQNITDEKGHTLKKFFALMLLIGLTLPAVFAAQGDLAAVMEVLNEGVEVKRVGTESWIAVSVEAIVGVGDSIRTDDTGRARVTFFSDGVETVIEPNTEYAIEAFNGDTDTFEIRVTVLAGQTRQRLNRLLDAGSSYDVNTPGANLVARGTVFEVRVEDDGRSAMLVSEGEVGATGNTGDEAAVPALFGVRVPVGGELSDVVQAATFGQLDAALDGCTASVATPDDVRINVRLGAGLSYPVVGTVLDDEVNNLKGITEGGGWYRIDFRDGYGWILSSSVNIENSCAGLRSFPDNAGPEDATLYSFLGDPITLDDLTVPEPTPAPELEPTPSTEG